MKADELWPVVSARLRIYIGQTWNVQIIADVTGSNPATVGGWMSNTAPPVGERLVRLWHFLDAVGIKSPELHKLPSFNRYLGQLLTFGVMRMEEVCEALNVKNTQTVLQVLRGTEPMRPQYNLHELRTLYDEKLEMARSKYPKFEQMPKTDTQVIKQPHRSETRNTTESIEGMVVQSGKDPSLALAAMCGAALPLARYMLSEDVSSAQRSYFRDLLGQQTLFEFLNNLTALQSERARNSRK